MTAGAVAVPTIVPLRPPVIGKFKSLIDTNTKVELRTETAGASIYFTINGSKPEPFQTVGPKHTFKYKEPFNVPEGKRQIKAIAVAEDGLRESHIVTKKFDVEYVEPDPPPRDEDSLDFIDDMHSTKSFSAKKASKSLMHKMVTAKEAWSDLQRIKEAESMMEDLRVGGSNNRKPQNGTRFLNKRLGSTSDRATIGAPGTIGTSDGLSTNGPHHTDQLMRSDRWKPPDNATQAMRLQRETDFLKCIYCYAPRPADPYARFCHDCGSPVPPLPESRLPPPEAGQMGMCVHCNSMVPYNTLTCVICEAPIPPQNQAQASVRLSAKVACTVCGTANPANISSCVTCEAKLPANAKPIYSGQSAPPMPSQEGRLLTCTKCQRVNNSDARFCDWCGAKPSQPSSSLVCSKCHASNHPYAQFCGTCGVLMEPPTRIDPRNGGITVNLNSSQPGNQPSWMPVNLPNTASQRVIPTASTATQTVGLFYPSQRDISKKHSQDEERAAIEKEMSDRKPLLTAISPGKGYWRKQMEHICTHLKAHAANNAEFRALIAEPRMGKIVSTHVEEDSYELSLTVNFTMKGAKDPFAGKKMDMSKGDFLSNYTEGRGMRRYGSASSLGSARSEDSAVKKTKKKVVKKVPKKTKKPPKEDKQTSADRQLLKEVGKNGEGIPDEVQQLIDEGADPNCISNNDVPVLHIAVKNKHIDAIPILVQEGADVNVKGPEKGNTALHEAVHLGHAGHEVIDVLLGCGANPNKKNEKGETPYDLAVKSGVDSISNKLASSLGQSQLDKLIKPKAASKVDF